MTIDPRERLRRIDPAPPDVEPPSGALGAVAVIHEIERRMGVGTRDTTDDTETSLGVTQQIEPGASNEANDTPTKHEWKRRWSGALVAAAAFGIVLAIVGAAVLLATVDSDDAVTPAAGPVTFRVKLNLADPPVRGTFVVDTGADVLGCSSGTVVQVDNSETFGNNVMTCDSGPNTGTFTIYHGGEDVRVWNVLEGSEDFAGLQGEGSWDFVITSANAGSVVETFTGDIEYAP